MDSIRIDISVQDGISKAVALECTARFLKDMEGDRRKTSISQPSSGYRRYNWMIEYDTCEGPVSVWTKDYRTNDCFIIKKG